MKKTIFHKCIILLIFIFVALVIECVYFGVQFGQLFPSYFFYDLSILLFLGAISLLFGKYKGQIVVSSVFWIIEIVLITANLSLAGANGDVFTWDMLTLLVDASKAATGAGAVSFFAFKELIILIFIMLSGLGGMIFYYHRLLKEDKEKQGFKKYSRNIICMGLISLICISTNALNVLYIREKEYKYKVSSDEYLYDSSFINQEALESFGTFGFYYINALNTAERIFKPNQKTINNLENYLLEGENSNHNNDYTGVSAGNNLIYILFETGEYFGIHPELTPNLFSLITSQGIMDKNNNILDGGLLLSNYHSKSQTNISEAQSLFGSYPLTGILNYNYLDNYYPFTLPNKFKEAYPNAMVNSYHSNDGNYYNRYDAHQHYGFDKHYAAEDMQIGESTSSTWIRMDSQMFDKCLTSSSTISDTVAPLVPENLNEPFFSYLISFSTHGPFENRDDLENNKKIVEEKIAEPYTTLHGNLIDLNNDIYGEEIKTYLAAAYDFDLGIGKLIDDLRAKDELENTTIMIFSDHYAYYSNLSALSKGYNEDDVVYPEIYNVPAFLFDTKLKTKIKENVEKDNNIEIMDYYNTQVTKYTKFCGNIDFAPTLLNILGIDYNPHLYTGRDIFSKQKSFVLSRYGGIFNDKFYTSDGKKIDNLPEVYYEYEKLEKKGLEIIEKEELLYQEYLQLKNEVDIFYKEVSDFLIREDYIDLIYRSAYFGKH